MIQALITFIDHNFTALSTGAHVWLAGSLVFLAVALYLRRRA